MPHARCQPREMNFAIRLGFPSRNQACSWRAVAREDSWTENRAGGSASWERVVGYWIWKGGFSLASGHGLENFAKTHVIGPSRCASLLAAIPSSMVVDLAAAAPTLWRAIAKSVAPFSSRCKVPCSTV